jgi:hypothetical protein
VTQKKGRHSVYKSRIRRVLKEKMGKQINVLPVWIDSLLAKKTRSVAVEGRSESRN